MPELAPSAPAHAFAEGQVLVNLGNSWGIPDYFRGLRAAQRARGVRYVPFLHDCVPLVMPEHCVRTLVEDYARWFAAMGVHAHGVLCNSEATRADGRRFLDALLPGLDLPMEVVRLDGDPRGTAPPDPAALEGTRAPRPPEPYVLFVATIESRKDHLTVFRAWLSLLRRHGPGRIPRLVCVGAPGWGVEAATNLLAGSPELSRHVVVLHGVSDGALSALYRDSLFTVYNSHHEGWGLPVTESLAWGRCRWCPATRPFSNPARAARSSSSRRATRTWPRRWSGCSSSPAPWRRRSGWWPRGAPRGAGRRCWRTSRPVSPPSPRAPSCRPPGASRCRSGSASPSGAPTRRGPTSRSPSPTRSATARAGSPRRTGARRSRAGRRGSGCACRRTPPGRFASISELRGPGGAPLGLALRADGAPLGTAAIPAPPGGDFAAALPVEVAEGTEVLELEIDAPAGHGLRALMLCRADDLLARLDFLEAQRLPPVRAAS